MYDDLSLESFMSGLKQRNPHEPEFHQAVQEVAQSVIPFILDNPRYQEAVKIAKAASDREIVVVEIAD